MFLNNYHLLYFSNTVCLLPAGNNHPSTMTLSPERQSVWMSKITNDDLTQSGTRCFIAVPIWQQWASKG